ncbi:putative non-inhibitory serpin-Z5 [Raphanus sativus]|nr:putative non-inhibitory serpin-Z5 [Raphanus sativus]
MVTSDTDRIYGNALYFKGTWEQKFPKSLTSDLEFHLLNGGSVTVPFMRNNKNQYVEQYEGFKVLKLPFRQFGDINRQYSRVASYDVSLTRRSFFPSSKNGPYLAVRWAFGGICGFLDSHTPRKQVEVGQFCIPKFKIEFGFEASSAFKGLNLDSVSLRHKALVEIDEDGAEAAAVTVSCMVMAWV